MAERSVPRRAPAPQPRCAVDDHRLAELARMTSSLADRVEARPPPDSADDACERQQRVAVLRWVAARCEGVLQQRHTAQAAHRRQSS